MATPKETLNATLAQLKAQKAAKVETEFAKVKNSEVIPQQAKIETAKNAAVAEYNKEHQNNLSKLAADYNTKLAQMKAEYDASIKNENDSYAASIAKLNQDAVSKKQEIETMKRAEIEASISTEFDGSISAVEQAIANLG